MHNQLQYIVIVHGHFNYYLHSVCGRNQSVYVVCMCIFYKKKKITRVRTSVFISFIK